MTRSFLYGVIEANSKWKFKISEKPIIASSVSGGIYVINAELVQL